MAVLRYLGKVVFELGHMNSTKLVKGALDKHNIFLQTASYPFDAPRVMRLHTSGGIHATLPNY